MKPTIPLFALWATVLLGPAAGLSAEPDQKPLTAVQARDALLRYIRANPDAFAGHPDPDKLVRVPLKPAENGDYWFGRFRLHLTRRTYSADVELQALYFYDGSFIERGGVWTATAPRVQILDRALPKSN